MDCVSIFLYYNFIIDIVVIECFVKKLNMLQNQKTIFLFLRIRFEANNDGVWAFHCAMTAHSVMGMGFNVITSPERLSPPPPGLRSCTKTSVDPSDVEVCTSSRSYSIQSSANNRSSSSSTSPSSKNILRRRKRKRDHYDQHKINKSKRDKKSDHDAAFNEKSKSHPRKNERSRSS